MTPFEQLYNYCQTLPLQPYIPRNSIRDKVIEITGRGVVIYKVSLDLSTSRGYFIDASNADHPFIKQAGGRSVILLARDMNKCWERLVQVKELMHLFDTEGSKTSSKESFEELVNDIMAPVPSAVRNPQLISEQRAVWMALACLCPEALRQQFAADVERKHVDHYGIAMKLRIPEKYVPYLLRPTFPQIIAKYIEEGI